MKITKEEEKKKSLMGSDEVRERIERTRSRKEEEEEEGVSKRDDDKEEENGKTVVVGVKMNQQSRELLTWALVKVAEPGDRVVALHVLPSASTAVSDLDVNSSSLLSLVKAFDSVIAVYEGFCNLKQIDLKLKICRGSSIRKALVREANSFSANKLILGIAKNSRSIGSSSVSIAKYCAKKLPRDCTVLAVNNGKIIFQRETPSSSPMAVQRSSSKNSYSSSRSVAASMFLPPCLDTASEDESNCSIIDADNNSSSSSSEVQPEQSCSICSSQGGNEFPSTNSTEDGSLAIVPVQKLEAPLSSLSISVSELRRGWPLLRRAVSSKRKTASSERKKISVVQWAMRLPSRYSISSAVHPDRKPTKLDANVTSNFDEGSGAVVPVRTDSSRLSFVIGDYKEEEVPKELESLKEKYSSLCRLFSYKELKHATSNFAPEKLIGKGGSSRVYKGCLSDGKELAVKVLKPSEDAVKEFVLEIEIITTLHHKNIISLFGFCFENNILILVYDFLPRGSLEETLHGEKDNKYVLSWVERYKVAIGVAEALEYLHGGENTQPVIHRDVKSSNILLSDDFEPQLSDFGFAKWASASASNVTCSDVAGTFGYLAPEYFMYGKVNEKIDVYAFGVVLLELLSGRKPISSECPKGQESLVMWAKPILQDGKTKQLMDPCLGTKYDNDQMERMILAASLCIIRTARSRPRITLVLKLLQGDEEALKWARSQISGSEEFDGLDDEAPYPDSNIQSHLNLALLDIEDDSLTISSVEHTVDSEDYLQGRWSRSSSFD